MQAYQMHDLSGKISKATEVGFWDIFGEDSLGRVERYSGVGVSYSEILVVSVVGCCADDVLFFLWVEGAGEFLTHGGEADLVDGMSVV